MSGAVGSTPSLIRSGRPSFSFSLSASTLRTLAVPDVRIFKASSTLFSKSLLMARGGCMDSASVSSRKIGL